jgi:hypothetical protein
LRCVKWAEECGIMVLYKDPFVLKHKNNYRLLRKIHYQVKKRKMLKFELIDDKYDDWKSEIVEWYNKWVNEGYTPNQKQLYLYGESFKEFNDFIKKLMGNLFYFIF